METNRTPAKTNSGTQFPSGYATRRRTHDKSALAGSSALRRRLPPRALSNKKAAALAAAFNEHSRSRLHLIGL